MTKRPKFCLVRDATLRCADFNCLCGWPQQPCEQMYPGGFAPPMSLDPDGTDGTRPILFIPAS